MVSLEDKLLAHKALGDYVMSNKLGAQKSSQTNVRLAALAVLEADLDDMAGPLTVVSQKLNEMREDEAYKVLEGEDETTNVGLFTLLGKAAWKFGKKFAGTAVRWALAGARFLGRNILRFLIRGLLMPVAGAVVSVLGLPVTIALGVAGISTYLLYKMYGNAADEQAIKDKYGKFLMDTSKPTAVQTFAGSAMQPTEQQILVTTGQQKKALAISGTAPSGNGVQEFISSIDPQLIEIGKANVYLADPGVDIAGMNQDFMTIFYGMVGDWVQQGGSKVRINSGYRDIAKQQRLYDAWLARGMTGGAVARPGRSRHQRGLALDIASVSANAMAKNGLLAKYKFIRPVRGEPWHLENILFGSGAATAKAVKEAKADKAVVDQPTQVKAAETTWLDRMRQNPDAIAENDWQEQARQHPEIYRDEKGNPKTYRQIYEKTQLQLSETNLDATTKEVETPKQVKTEPEVIPQEQSSRTSVDDETKQTTWIKKGKHLIRN